MAWLSQGLAWSNTIKKKQLPSSLCAILILWNICILSLLGKNLLSSFYFLFHQIYWWLFTSFWFYWELSINKYQKHQMSCPDSRKKDVFFQFLSFYSISILSKRHHKEVHNCNAFPRIWRPPQLKYCMFQKIMLPWTHHPHNKRTCVWVPFFNRKRAAGQN